jgi:hypothetical protein
MGEPVVPASAIQTVPPEPASSSSAISAARPAPAKSIVQRPKSLARQLFRKALRALASLRLTVILFAFALLLIFFGTLAQMDQGIYTVLKTYFRAGIAWIPWQLFVRFGQVFFGVSPDAVVQGSFPFPGGWLIGTLLLANLVAAHAVRFRISWKRSGILILHSGLIVLMLGELVAGLFQVEGRMTIQEGTAQNYTEDYHKYELAVVDQSDPKQDKVVVIPGSILMKRGDSQDDLLPFDVTVDRYMPNSAAADRRTGEENLATAGDGLRLLAVERPPVSGTGSEIDMPAAYVTFREKSTGRPLGTYMLAVWYSNRPQTVRVGGKSYQVAYRLERTYRPYSLHLIRFSFDRYKGTELARNYSSQVRLVDPEENEDREVLISMNDPLRYRGETFYQSSFDEKTEEATVLQVVRNPGWLMPYISCALVAVGMLIHFGLHLVGFLQGRFAA